MITHEQFIAATGREPKQDDLERCNCPVAGSFGHWWCGWDDQANLPRFMSGVMARSRDILPHDKPSDDFGKLPKLRVLR